MNLEECPFCGADAENWEPTGRGMVLCLSCLAEWDQEIRALGGQNRMRSASWLGRNAPGKVEE